MLIKTLPVGQLETNCYVVTNEDTLCCVVIDPGDESNTILDYMESNRLKCEAIFMTHGHFDHIGALCAVSEETGADTYMNEKDTMINNGILRRGVELPEGLKSYDDGDVLEYAGMKFEILSTPGHTPGGVCIKVNDALFTGDTLFRGSCGRVDLPGGDPQEEMRSLKKICSLEGDFEVYPGHMDSSTLQRERSFNYYCREAMKIF